MAVGCRCPSTTRSVSILGGSWGGRGKHPLVNFWGYMDEVRVSSGVRSAVQMLPLPPAPPAQDELREREQRKGR